MKNRQSIGKFSPVAGLKQSSASNKGKPSNNALKRSSVSLSSQITTRPAVGYNLPSFRDYSSFSSDYTPSYKHTTPSLQSKNIHRDGLIPSFKQCTASSSNPLSSLRQRLSTHHVQFQSQQQRGMATQQTASGSQTGSFDPMQFTTPELKSTKPKIQTTRVDTSSTQSAQTQNATTQANMGAPAAAAAVSPTPTPTRARRPVRSAVTVTPSASDRIKFLCDQQETPAKGIRLGVRTRGCNGMSYTMNFADAPQNKFDEVVPIPQSDINLFVDNKALLHVIGTTMDYVETDVSAEFVFNNPNSKGSCGCGESFTT